MSCRLRDDKVNDLKVKSLLSFTELSSFMIQSLLLFTDCVYDSKINSLMSCTGLSNSKCGRLLAFYVYRLIEFLYKVCALIRCCR